MGDERGTVQRYLSDVRDSVEEYTGLYLGSGLQAAETLGSSVFRDTLNPVGLDHLFVHPYFSKDLGKAADRGGEQLGEYLEERDSDYVASAGEALQDPYTRQALAFGAVSAFTAAKELWYDQNPDGLDAAGNYAGLSYHLLTEHHDIDPLSPAKDLYQEAKDELGRRL
ncbi:MAG: hypothetical protein SV186_06810 [Candidatus Nanohaloarchaea archaeon]|nr:hypothetical protein [Candidatus Nanohaloarchaea archaeon]